MKAKSKQPLSSELLAAYLEGTVTAHEATRIERDLEACSTSRRHLEELRRIRDALSAAAPEVDDLDLVAAVRNQAHAPGAARAGARSSVFSRARMGFSVFSRARAALPEFGRAPRRLPAFAALAAGASIAAVFLAVAVSQQNSPSAADHEFRSKAASSAAAQERWTGIRIYRVVQDQAPERVTESLDRRDTLLFSYTNLGPEPFEYLMIFAVGDDRRVYWFYPAYEAASETPQSVRIEAGNALLADAVEHDYLGERLEVYALFSRRPERVSRIEAWLHEHAEPLDAAPIPEASLRRVSLRVRP
ncbi:MAG TPA: hypothetical protein VFU02_07685 [Polyangiaceae bacterium]|nr:hypothetical protein [Polyangiaceae bacterium]